MKYKIVKALICSVAFTAMPLAGLHAEGTVVSKLAPLTFLVGDWRGELPARPNAQKVTVESKFDWTANHQGIRFESTWLIGDKHYPYTSGLYVWDPEKNRPMITYTDAEGTLTTGFVEMTGDVYQHELRVVDARGKAKSVRATLAHTDENAYTNTIYIMKDGKWDKFAEVRYVKSQ